MKKIRLSTMLLTAILAVGSVSALPPTLGPSIDTPPTRSLPGTPLQNVENNYRKVDANHYAKVQSNLLSIPLSNVATSATPLQLPLYLEPTEEEASLFTIADEDGDGRTFYYGQHPYGEKGIIGMGRLDYDASDNWLWLPGVELTELGKLYYFSCDVGTCGPIYPLTYEVLLCTDTNPESVVKTIAGPTTIEAFPWNITEVKPEFVIDEPGTYYIAIHDISVDGVETVWNHFKVDASPLFLDSPGAVTDVNVEAAPLGELKALITLKLPTKDYSGNDLPADETIEADIEYPNGSAIVSGKPGADAALSFPSVQGYNDITITTRRGEKPGISVSARVFTGIDEALCPHNIRRTTDPTNNVVIITWEPPVEGVHGGYVSPTGHTYNIQQLNGTQIYVLMELGTDVYTASVPIESYGVQGAITLGVGIDDMGGSFNNIVVGDPYILPINEKISKGSIKYKPLQREYYLGDEYRGTWWYGKPNWGEPDWMVDVDPYRVVSTNYPNVPTKGRLTLPRFTTKGQTSCKIDMEIFCGGYNQVEFLGWSHDMEEPISLLTVKDGDYPRGYRTITIELPESLLDRGWVEILVEPTMMHDEECFLMGDYMVHNDIAQDMGVVEISGLPVIHAGNVVQYNVTIGNLGYENTTVRDGVFSVKTTDGRVLYSENLSAQGLSIEPGDLLAHQFEFEVPTTFPTEVIVCFSFEGDDGKSDNNSFELPVTVYTGGPRAVSDLTATADADTPGHVNLTWSAPLHASGYETFEYSTAFDPYAELGEFKTYDEDQKIIVCFSTFFPYPNAFEPAGFQTFSVQEMYQYDLTNVQAIYPSHKGDRYVFALCPASYYNEMGQPVIGGAADDWLVSPRVEGGSDISFYARGINYIYGEEPIEILYSSASDAVEDFQLLKSIELYQNVAVPQWEEITCTLPDDAKYFAIRYLGDDRFGVCIDDIVYTPAKRDDIAGYDIYRDDELIETCTAAEGSYKDTSDKENKHYRYNVVPVDMDGNKGDMSNDASVNPFSSGIFAAKAQGTVTGEQGLIRVNGFDGTSVAVYNVAGVEVGYSENGSDARFPLTSGVYLVKADGKVFKVVVK